MANKKGQLSQGSNLLYLISRAKDVSTEDIYNYFESENYSNSINSISVDTGISVKNLNRYLENEEFSGLSSKLHIGINL